MSGYLVGAGQAGQTANVAYPNQGALQKQTQMPAPPPGTLLRAMSQVDSLNTRLSELSAHVEKIAISIGGPWPCPDSPSQGKPAAVDPAAMIALNDGIDVAHGRVTSIEESVAAIRRALGA